MQKASQYRYSFYLFVMSVRFLPSRTPDEPFSAFQILMKTVFFMLELYHPRCCVAS